MIVNLMGYEPPAREDGQGWVKAIIDRGSTSSGPWTQVTEVTLNPLDSDPSNPRVRNFTLDDPDGTTDSWYTVRFVDAAARETQPSTPITGAYRVLYLPALHEVGSLSRTRTKVDSGELGTFTTLTRPTSADVRDLIRQAGNDVAAKVGYAVPGNVLEAAKNAVKLKTAMLIELSYFAEQVQSNRSPYQQLKDLFDSDMTALEEAVAESIADNAVDVDYEGMPSYGGFDSCNSTSMVDPW
jgi:hypothetical protein